MPATVKCLPSRQARPDERLRNLASAQSGVDEQETGGVKEGSERRR